MTISTENDKHYWMIRTDNGANYETFSEHNFIALNLKDFPVAFLREDVVLFEPQKERLSRIKQRIKELHQRQQIDLGNFAEDRHYNSTIGRLASQIHTITYDIKRGDIVIIPDQGAQRLKIGRIVDLDLIADEDDARHFSFARKVEWIKEISKRHLDPCLGLALGAHQAICDITKYSEYIERNYNSCFANNGKYHFVLTVNSEEISAFKFTALIQDVLNQVKNISNEFDLGIDVDSINISVNVNSPGKFGFSTSAKTALLIVATFIGLSGGSISFGDFHMEPNGLFSTLVECITELQNNQEELREKRELFDSYMRSLDLKTVEEWNAEIDMLEETELENDILNNNN